MDEKSVSRWHKELKKHVPNQKTQIAAQVVKHLQYIMAHSDNPFLCSIAAGQWMNMAGMCRDAHIQRSYLLKTNEHAYICIEGKDASKPFNRTLPKATWGEGNVTNVRRNDELLPHDIPRR